jgi:Ser/Thr protein kinase RdoA (MazF antagonist)
MVMNAAQVARLCAACDLGGPTGDLLGVPGGLLHRLWRLDTTQGAFAVKQLNPAVMRRPHVRAAYCLSEQIAAEMATHGVPAVAALACDGDPVREIDDITALVYPWIDGEVLAASSVEPERGRQVGAVLGHIHALNLQFPALPLSEWGSFHDDDWDLLTVHAYDQGISWARHVRVAMPQLSEWSRLYEQASVQLGQDMVVSHRDVDQKNVIWRDEHTPLLVDWEGAGLVNPTMELVGVALDWSGLATEMVREDTFNALIEGYVGAGGIVRVAGSAALHGVMGIWLGWLLFNMQRSLGEFTSGEDERQIGIRETGVALAKLRQLARYAEQWASWIERWHG